MPYADPERRRQRQRAAYMADPEKFRQRKRVGATPRRIVAGGNDPAANRRRHLARHGLSLEGFAALLEFQSGACAICGSTEPRGRGQFHVDHDHSHCPGSYSCGRCVRGLLCCECNMANGALDWPTGRLVALVRYRRSPPWPAVVAEKPWLVHPMLWSDDAS